MNEAKHSIRIREELPCDIEAIVEVHDIAFGRQTEGMLVNELRNEGVIVASIVAEANGKVIGSAVFSKLSTTGASASAMKAAALAPVAVLPTFHRRGIGEHVIEMGLKLCADRGYQAVFVLGDPHYYGRFGFSSALAKRFDSVYRGPHWMAMELVRGALDGVSCVVRYPQPFSDVD